jgi:hypothetical protein
MLVLGISIGVSFNVIFAEWMITILLTIIFTGNSCLHCSFFFFFVLHGRAALQLWQPGLSSRVFEKWRKETRTKKVV